MLDSIPAPFCLSNEGGCQKKSLPFSNPPPQNKAPGSLLQPFPIALASLPPSFPSHPGLAATEGFLGGQGWERSRFPLPIAALPPSHRSSSPSLPSHIPPSAWQEAEQHRAGRLRRDSGGGWSSAIDSAQPRTDPTGGEQVEGRAERSRRQGPGSRGASGAGQGAAPGLPSLPAAGPRCAGSSLPPGHP